MIASRRAPGAKLTTITPPKPPRERHPIQVLRAKLRRRSPAPPVDLRRWEMVAVTVVAALAVLAVIGIAAVISYSHMSDWAAANGEPSWRAKLFPLSVDGSILAATLVLYADSRSGRRSSPLAYGITFLGIAWSVGANIGHTWVDPLAAKIIAGWPPIAMALSVELLFRFIRRWRGQADAAARKAERKAAAAVVKPVAPEQPVAEPVATVVPIQAHRPDPAPRPRPMTPAPDLPEWMPEGEGVNAKQACEAYLALHPDAMGPELEREVGPYFRVGDRYARMQVQAHKARMAHATAEGN